MTVQHIAHEAELLLNNSHKRIVPLIFIPYPGIQDGLRLTQWCLPVSSPGC